MVWHQDDRNTSHMKIISVETKPKIVWGISLKISLHLKGPLQTVPKYNLTEPVVQTFSIVHMKWMNDWLNQL